MEEIFKQYGPTIVTAVAAGLLFAILFASWGGAIDGSIFTYVGDKSVESQLEDVVVDATEYDTQEDKQQLDTFASRALPTVATNGHVKEHQSFVLVDAFTIKDCDGRIWKQSQKQFVGSSDTKSGVVQILSITDSEGHEYIDNATVFNKNTYTVNFQSAGTYYVTLRVLDYYNVETNVKVPLAVDLAL